MKKLKDLMGTRYIGSWHESELQRVLRGVTEVDLCDCKFGPNCANRLAEFYGKVKFINSTDKDLDDILQRNAHAKAVSSAELKTEPLRICFANVDAFIRYIDNLQEDTIYTLDVSKGVTRVGVYVCTLITIKRPEITLNVGSALRDIYEEVRKVWLPHAQPHSKYTEVAKSALVEREVNNGNVYMPGMGYLAVDKYVSKYNVLPAEFGTVPLTKNPEFKDVYRYMLSKLFAKKAKRRTLLNELNMENQ